MFLSVTFGRPLRETKQSVDSAEFVKWRAYYRVEPWGDEWLRTSSMMSLLFNRWRKPGSPKAEADDFIPKVRKTAFKKSPDQIAAMLTMYATMHNATQRKA